MKNLGRSAIAKNPKEAKWTLIFLIFGFLIGILFAKIRETLNNVNIGYETKELTTYQNATDPTKKFKETFRDHIWVTSNPKGAERLPPKIVESESDLFLRRLWGDPREDLINVPKYLVTFTVGYKQKNNINAAVKKFSDNFTIILFHYDDRVDEWDEFEWSKRAIHVSATRQTKWWFAKRFLHPNIVAAYEYIFIWDEDLGVKNFNAEEYVKLIKKHGLEISQPASEPIEGDQILWKITQKRNGSEVHNEADQGDDRCEKSHSHSPPCAAFVEIQAPVFSRDSWRCVWHMIQNDLVHGWGLDFAFQRCFLAAHEKIGIVDEQSIVHQRIPSLTNEGVPENGESGKQKVMDRCRKEWEMFDKRLKDAENAYNKSIGIDHFNVTNPVRK